MANDKHLEALAKLASANPNAYRDVCEWLQSLHDKRLKILISAAEFGEMRFEQGRMSELESLKAALVKAKDSL